jgi:Uma2 family endonuclease
MSALTIEETVTVVRSGPPPETKPSKSTRSILPDPQDDAWTVEDWLHLNETDPRGNRYELIDGSLAVSPAPAMWHQWVADELRWHLRNCLPNDLVAVTAAGMPIDEENAYIPDLLVLTRAHLESGKTLVSADATRLVVEVVSPSTRMKDRRIKPIKYAEAGIAHYWRIEPNPFRGQGGDRLPVLFAYLLDAEGEYQLTHRVPAGSVFKASEPFAFELDPAALSPVR